MLQMAKALHIHYKTNQDWIPMQANSTVPICNVYFDGNLTLRIKQQGDGYFKDKKRLYAIEFEGKFIDDFTADDLMMAADFERALTLPLGIGIMERFVRIIDPALQLALKQPSPFIQSPVVCAFNTVGTSDVQINTFLENILDQSNYSKRRKYFLSQQNRQAYAVRKDQFYQFEWYSPYVDFNNFELTLGFKYKFYKQLNGQPVVFSCRSRDSSRILFQLKFELL